MRIHFHHAASAGDIEQVRAVYFRVMKQLRMFLKEKKILAYIGEIVGDEASGLNSPSVHSGYYYEAFADSRYPYCQFVIYFEESDVERSTDEIKWEKWIKSEGLELTLHHPLQDDELYLSRVKRHYEFLDAVKRQDEKAIKLFLSEKRGILFEDLEGNNYMQYATFKQIAYIGDYARLNVNYGVRETNPYICKRCGRPYKPNPKVGVKNRKWCGPCIAESFKGVFDQGI